MYMYMYIYIYTHRSVHHLNRYCAFYIEPPSPTPTAGLRDSAVSKVCSPWVASSSSSSVIAVAMPYRLNINFRRGNSSDETPLEKTPVNCDVLAHGSRDLCFQKLCQISSVMDGVLWQYGHSPTGDSFQLQYPRRTWAYVFLFEYLLRLFMT